MEWSEVIRDESGCPSGRAPPPSAVSWRVGLSTPSGRRQSAGERNSRLLAVRDSWLLSAALRALKAKQRPRELIFYRALRAIFVCAHGMSFGVLCCMVRIGRRSNAR
jgi:hypothetical protein